MIEIQRRRFSTNSKTQSTYLSKLRCKFLSLYDQFDFQKIGVTESPKARGQAGEKRIE